MIVGFQKLTSAGVVSTSGQAIAVFGLNIESKATGSAVVSTYDGTSTSGTKTNVFSGSTNEWVTINYSEGRCFPNGLYVDMDSNTNSVVIWFQKVPY